MKALRLNTASQKGRCSNPPASHRVAQQVVDACLPAGAGGFQGVKHIGIHSHGQRHLGPAQRRAATQRAQLSEIGVGQLDRVRRGG